jgi:hypothetical protein
LNGDTTQTGCCNVSRNSVFPTQTVGILFANEPNNAQEQTTTITFARFTAFSAGWHFSL